MQFDESIKNELVSKIVGKTAKLYRRWRILFCLAKGDKQFRDH